MSGTLHLIVRQQDSDQLRECAKLLQPADRVVLLGPAASSSLQLADLGALSAGVWHVMADDLRQYGADPKQLPAGVAAIDAKRLLQLSIECRRSLSW